MPPNHLPKTWKSGRNQARGNPPAADRRDAAQIRRPVSGEFIADDENPAVEMCVCVCALRCGVKIKVIQTSGLRFEMKFADRPTQSSPAQSSALTASTCGNFWKVYTPQCCANGTPIGQLLAWSIWSFAECLDAMTTDWWTSSISFSVFSFSFLNWNGRVPGRCPQTITVLLATHFRGHLCFHSPLLRLLCFCWVEGMSSWTRSLYETRG